MPTRKRCAAKKHTCICIGDSTRPDASFSTANKKAMYSEETYMHMHRLVRAAVSELEESQQVRHAKRGSQIAT